MVHNLATRHIGEHEYININININIRMGYGETG